MRSRLVSVVIVGALCLGPSINSSFASDSDLPILKFAPSAPTSPSAGGSPGAPSFPVLCSTGDTGPKLQAVYAYDETTPIKETDLNDIRIMMQESDRIVFLSSEKQSKTSSRRLRIATEADKGSSGCIVSIVNLPLPHSYFTDTTSEESIFPIVESSGIINPSNKTSDGVIPVVFVASNPKNISPCGLSDVVQDDSPYGYNSKPNSNVSVIWKDCWNAYTAIHEIMHALGAIQDGAPNSAKNNHCFDGIDVMCYDEETSKHPQELICPSTSYRVGGLLDCNGDDYFSVEPFTGSYLDTHYNIANDSPYLIKVPASGIEWPSIKITSNSSALTYPFVGVPFTAKVNTPGGFLFADSAHSFGNDNCGVSLVTKNPNKGSLVNTIRGVAYCRTPFSDIRNVNYIKVASQQRVKGSHFAVADLMGRDVEGDIAFKLLPLYGLPKVAITHKITRPNIKNKNTFTIQLKIRGQLPDHKKIDTPLVGVEYMVFDDKAMREIPQNGIYEEDQVSDANGSMYFHFPASYAGHLIDFDANLSGNESWDFPFIQIKLPK